ncbi:L,D-transpeptidase family protein [Hansschlegelia sp. KR7-227]|uniref:L,D-transpeptidase family protein n=1 Tax=Hansschlegelia sp. KR7-227 TaxID=3400914 RepID=UPI003C0B0BAA
MSKAPKRRLLRVVEVRSTPADRARGRLVAGSMRLSCALGPAGVVAQKREGDGGTPRGALAIRKLWRRPDRGPRPSTALRVGVIRRDDGWCDDIRLRRYNRLVRLPFSGSHERLWREDGLYDLVAELGWNDRPPRRGRGSAIFLHVARPGLTPTEGCVALGRGELRRLLARIGPRTVMRVGQTKPRPRRRAR